MDTLGEDEHIPSEFGSDGKRGEVPRGPLHYMSRGELISL